jgi:hypothetical protein
MFTNPRSYMRSGAQPRLPNHDCKAGRSLSVHCSPAGWWPPPELLFDRTRRRRLFRAACP